MLSRLICTSWNNHLAIPKWRILPAHVLWPSFHRPPALGNYHTTSLAKQDVLVIDETSQDEDTNPSEKLRSRQRRKYSLERHREANLALSEAVRGKPRQSKHTIHDGWSSTDHDTLQSSNRWEHVKKRLHARAAASDRMSFVRSCLGIYTSSSKTGCSLFSDKPKRDIVFLALDTEGGERRISEIGLAMLDTRSIAGTNSFSDQSSGGGHSEWIPHIQARHFAAPIPSSFSRIRAYGRQKFLFGKTQHLPLKTATMKPHLYHLFDPTRTYVLVGHNVQVDLRKLATLLHYDIRRLPNVVRVIDTLDLIRASPNGATMPLKLEALWRHIRGVAANEVDPAATATATANEITGDAQSSESDRLVSGFHNAGNDAVYTLQVLLMLAMTPDRDWAGVSP